MPKLIDREDVSLVQCNQCNKPFEQDEDLDSNDVPSTFVSVPVECDKGNFCSEACRARAMYEAQDEAGKKILRRYYLGAQLMYDYRRDAEKLVKDWDLYIGGDAEDVCVALSPDGGVRGVPGPEDDCEALLVPKDVRKVLWNGLWMGRRAAIADVARAEEHVKQWDTEYWQKELADAKLRLVAAEESLHALEALRTVV